MVPKRSVVRVLHDTHDLDDVVAQMDYAGEDGLAEMGEAVDLGLGAAHADVDFVYFYACVGPVGLRVQPLVGGQVYVDAVEGIVGVLGREVYPGRDAVGCLAVLKLDLAFYL